MKRLVLACVAGSALCAHNAKANVYFDVNGTASGSGIAANGSYTWEGNFWSTDSTGVAATTAYDTIENGVTDTSFFPRFVAPSGVTGSYTITVNANHSIAGALMSVTTGNLTIQGTGNLSINTGQQGFFGGSGNMVFNNKLTGPGGVIGSSGQIWLNGPNDYSGGTTPGSGLLNFNSSSSFGTGSIIMSASGGAMIVEGTSAVTIPNAWSVTITPATVNCVGNTAGVTYSGNVTLGANTFNIGCGGAAGNIDIFSGVISGTGGIGRSAGQSPAGIVKFTGANTYTGKTTLQSGVTYANSLNKVSGGTANSSFGAPTTAANGTISIGATTFPATLVYAGTGETTDRVIDLGGTTGGATIQNDGSGALVFSSAFTASGVGAKTLTIQGSSTANSAINGAIVDSSSGATTLTKAGAGKWILGGANTYSGNTTVSVGTLAQGAANVIPNGTGKGTFAVSSGATFDLGGFNSTVNGFGTSAGTIDNTGAGAVTLTIGGANGGGTHSGVIQNTGGALTLTKTGTGTSTISGANTYTGKTIINQGQITINNAGGDISLGTAPAGFVADQLTFNGGALGTGSATSPVLSANRGITLLSGGGTFNLTSKDVTVQSQITGVGQLTKSGANNLNLNVANNFSGGFLITGGGVRFNDDNAGGTAGITVTPASIVTLRCLQPSAATVTLGNSITLNANGTYNTGGTDIDVAIGTGTNFVLNGAITGAGYLTRNRASGGSGNGTLTLNGDNSGWSGGMIHKGSQIAIGHKNALGTGTYTIVPAPASQPNPLVLQANATLTGANAVSTPIKFLIGISNSVPGFNITGSSALELSGPISVGDGTTGNVTPVITNNNAATVTLSGVISGAAGLGLSFDGTGTTVIANAANTYTGPTTIINGSVRVDGNITSSSGVTVNGGTLKGNGIVSAVTVNSTGAINPGASPGTLSVAGALAFNAGSTNIIEINDFNGTSGSNPGWDLINANTLAINGAIRLKVNSLNGTSSGAAANFSNTTDYDLLILHTTNGITAGDATLITVDSTDFAANNTLPAGGEFVVTAVTNLDSTVDLVLHYRRAPAISSQPAPATACIGATANFDVTATASSITYQWQKGGVNLSNGSQPSGAVVTGSTSANLTVAGVQVADADNYAVVISGSVGSPLTSSAAALTVPTPPVIATPTGTGSSVADAGTTVNYAVTLSAGTSISYQWQKGGVNLSNGAHDNGATVSGSTSANLTLTSVRALDSGDYTCIVSTPGGCGSAISAAQTLSVNDPVITQQPVNSTFECSSSNALTLTAIGTTNANGVLLYQWYNGDANSSVQMTDQTNATLVFNPASFANAGSYFAIVTNGIGNSITSSVVVVTVEDTNAPVITVLPGASSAECHTSYADPGATALDSCDGSVAVTTNGLPDVNTTGNYTITYSATDSHGNVASATRVVLIDDTTPPTLSLSGLGEITISCGTPYTDAGATASDSCAGDISGSIVPNFGGLVPSAPVGGDYTITYNVSDPKGNAATPISRIVHVVDHTAPVVTLNGAAVMTNECHTVFADPGVSAMDACAGDVTNSVRVVSNLDTNSLGIYTLTYVADDGSGNTNSSVTRVVHVEDHTPPVMTLNGDPAVTVECHGSYNDPSASGDDACEGSLTIAQSGTVDLNTVGIYTRTYTATDSSGNANSTTRQISVEDHTAPAITILGDNPATVECHTGYNDAGATVLDACDSTPSFATNNPVDANTTGQYTVTYTAVDASHNTNILTRVVNVVDTTRPVINVLGGTPMAVECHSSFTDPGATVSDTCDASPMISTNGPVDANTPGSYTITYIANDAALNYATNYRVVNVADTQPPTFNMIGTPTMTVECHGGFTDPGATAHDACEGDVAVVTNNPVNADVTGYYTITYSACDSSNHCASVLRVVHVNDSTAPSISLLGDNPMTVECHSAFVDPLATAADDCDNAPIVTPSGTVLTNIPGTYTMTYTAADASGNSVTTNRVVNVVDTSAPVISMIGTDMTAECHGSFTDPGATADDACEGPVAVTTNNPVDLTVVADYTITYSACDSGLHCTNVTRVVHVLDDVAPNVTVNPPLSDTVCLNSIYNDPGASGQDDCSGSLAAPLVGSGVDTSTLGIYTLTYQATDGSGNNGTATRVVTVVDCGVQITTQPSSKTKQPEGTNVTLSVVASTPYGTLTYQWFEQGVQIQDATNSAYSFNAHINNSAVPPTNVSYTVTVTGTNNSHADSTPAVVNVVVEKSTQVPRLTITSPAPNFRGGSSSFVLKGTATASGPNANVTTVKYYWTSVNVQQVDPVVIHPINLTNIVGSTPTRRSFTTTGFTLVNPTAPGTNILTIWAEDLAGHQSTPLQSRTVFYQVERNFDLTIDGDGTGKVKVTPRAAGSEPDLNAPPATSLLGSATPYHMKLYAYEAYAITFTPDTKTTNQPIATIASTVSNVPPALQTGHTILQAGQASTRPVSVLVKIDSDSAQTVYFNRNRFIEMAGSYNGVFSDANSPQIDSTGLLNMIVSKLGTYSGHIMNNGVSSNFHCSFNADGTTQLPFGNNRFTLSGSLAWAHSDDKNQPKQFIGTVSHTANDWTSSVTADKAETGLLVTGTKQSITIPSVAGGPSGVSIGKITDTSLSRSFNFSLADGATIAVDNGVPAAVSGNFPIYVYATYPRTDGSHSVLYGTWNTSSQQVQLNWIKDPNPHAVIDTAGFNIAPVATVVGVTNGLVGKHNIVFTNTATLFGTNYTWDFTAKQKVTGPPTFFVTVDRQSAGKLTIHFPHSKTNVIGYAGIEEDSQTGNGFFIEKNNTDSGIITIGPTKP